MIDFRSGSEVYVLPIRFYDIERPILKMRVVSDCSDLDRHVYGLVVGERDIQYYSKDRVFNSEANALEARELMCRLQAIKASDNTIGVMREVYRRFGGPINEVV